MDTLKSVVKLGDHEVELRFTNEAVLALSELDINLYSPSTWLDFKPHKLRDLVWAGQLHVKEPRTVRQIGKLIPLKADDFVALAGAVGNAVRRDLDLGGSS
jgi:hypothetical protein